ncbi:MAG: site-specific DNA-methyltransferase, partial [Phycisphaerae bacterium]|nr:site-specific DNA-methyltransferase [Phycisphaerae bacterium]
IFGPDETTQPRQKRYLTEDSTRQISSVLQDAKRGKTDLDALGLQNFPYCHAVSFYTELLGAATNGSLDVVLDYFVGSGTSGHAVIELNREDAGKRRFILVEMGDYFDTVLLPRIKKVTFSPEWKDGKPQRQATAEEAERSPRIVKYVRLESYEDALNNLVVPEELPQDDARREEHETRQQALRDNPGVREDYMLRYMLDVETRGSQSVLNVDDFAEPTAYKLKVKKPGSDEYECKNADLAETFNYLIGLHVEHIAAPQTFTAEFERPEDPELPEDQNTRLQVTDWVSPDAQGRVRTGSFRHDADGPWWFRKVEGTVRSPGGNATDGTRERVLIVWRNLTGDLETDNLMLDCWFQVNRINTRDWEFDTIYVNGSNNLPNLKREGDTWKVRLIEEDFRRLMWDVQDA